MKQSPDMYHFFFFNDTATTEIYTLSLHDALPILVVLDLDRGEKPQGYLLPLDEISPLYGKTWREIGLEDRKSTRLNSSHSQISYAVFCLKKKKHTHNVASPLLRAPSRATSSSRRF